MRFTGIDRTGTAHELLVARLNGASPEADVNIDLAHCAGGSLRITIDEGAYGPIQDRVILRRFMLLLAEPGL